MSTHADRIREAERAVADATVAERLFRTTLTSDTRDDWEYQVKRLKARRDETADALLALRAATCPTCGGTGDGERSRYAGCPGIVTPPCPANCDNGRRRDA